MIYRNYILVAHWKAQAAELGIDWRHVRENYNELRRIARDYEATIREVRQFAFWNGVTKSHPAFWSPHHDLDSIRGFDEIASEAAGIWPWLGTDGDPERKLFDLVAMNESDYRRTDNELWAEAIDKTIEELDAAADRFCPEEYELAEMEF